jgi:hypothetical protein
MQVRRAYFAASPAWAMLAIIISGIVAVQLIPEDDFHAPGALIGATLTLTAGLAAGPLLAAARNPLSLLRAEHLLCLGLFYWLLLDIVLGDPRIAYVSRDALVVSFASIAIFAAGIWTGSLLQARPIKGLSRAEMLLPGDLSPRFLFAAALISGLLATARVLIACRFGPSCIAEALYQPRFSAVWFRADAFGHLDTLFLYFRYFGFLVLPLTVALIAAEGRISRRSLATGLIGLLCLGMMIGDGGRKDVGTVVAASLVVWALSMRRLHLKHVLGVIILAVALVLLMQFMLSARAIGIGAALEQEAPPTRSPVGTVDRNFRALSAIVEVVPDRYPYNGWQGIAFAATRWVPGGLVPHEWQQRTVDLPAVLQLNAGRGYTWTCSAVGDLYMIGGLAAVAVGGIFFGLLAGLTGRMLTAPGSIQRPVLYSLLTMTLFLSLRALHEMFVTGFIVAAFAALLFARLVLSHRSLTLTQQRF